MCLDGAAEIPAEAERLDQPEVVFSVSIAACASIRHTRPSPHVLKTSEKLIFQDFIIDK